MQHLAPEALRRAEGLTLPRLVHRNAEEHGDLPAITSHGTTTSWRELRDAAAALSRAFHAHGLRRGDRMMIMMSSRLEHWQADLGAAHLGAVTCTVYRTSSAEQVGYMARHGKAVVAVLEDEADVARWLPSIETTLPDLKHIVVLDERAIPPGDGRFQSWAAFLAEGCALHTADPAAFVATWKDIAPGDPVTMMYTSGTTGDPKGVVLSHRSVFYSGALLDMLAPLPKHCAQVAYLPLAHISERQRSIYRFTYGAQHVHVVEPAELVPALMRVRPPGFFGVPRVWEKMAAALCGIVAGLPEDARAAAETARAEVLDAYRLDAAGEVVPPELAAKAAKSRDMLRPLLARVGLEEVQWASSGAAPIPVEVLEVLGGFGLRILEVWGMTETTGAITLSTQEHFRTGAVGRAVPGCEVKVADDGELLARGPLVLMGYLGADGSIVKATDDDGWFATGDVGTIDAEGYVRITDRKKELIITATGKNVAPSPIEGLLRAHPLVGQAMVIGDRRPYLTALFSLDPEAAPKWANEHGMAGATLAQVAESARVGEELDALVAQVNSRVSRPEQVKRYRVVGEAWIPGTDLLTPTMKMRRRAILEHYAMDVERLYDD